MNHRTARMRERALSLLLGSALALLAGPARADHDAELADLQMVLDAVEACSPDLKLTMLAAGVEEVARSHGWEGGCADAFGAYAKAPPDTRSALITAAFPGCQALCPGGPLRGESMLRLGMVPPLMRTAALAAACDASGAAPIFDGELLPLRGQMPIDGYWVFRAAFDLLRQRLDAIGGERAQALRTRYDELIPDVAAELALYLPPAEMLSRLPETTSRQPAYPGPALVVREDTPLDEELERIRGEGGENRLLIQMDRDLPVRVLARVLRAAGKAGFARFELAGIHPDEARQTVSPLSLPDLSRYLGTTGELYDRPPLLLTILLDDDGIAVAGSASSLVDVEGETRIGWDAGPDPYAELHELLERVKDEYPDEEEVNLVTEGELPYHRLMGVLDACRERTPTGPGHPDPLFPDVIYAIGGDLPVPDDLGASGALGGLIGTGGLGGLGTRGSGLGGGGSGYGSGGGVFGDGATGTQFTEDPIILGAIDKDDIEEVIRAHLPQIRYCYQRELTKQPDLAGKVTVKFVIGKSGTVSSASTKATTLNNEAVESCVTSRFMRMQFPAPVGGGIVIVSYPFLFKPADSVGE
jgi:biopolymer transport protein ExbD